MWKPCSVAIVLLLLSSLSFDQALSQESVSNVQKLTLSQCISMAIERSSNVKIAELDIRSASLSVKDAKAAYLPTVTINGQYQFSDKVDFGWDKRNYNATLSADYQIWDHGRRKTSLEQAKLNEVSAMDSYNRTIQDLIFNVTQAYYNLLEAEKYVDVDEKLIEISRANLEKVIAFQEAGKAIPADVAAARAQLASDELNLLNDKNNVELARARLASLMGMDPRTLFEIEDDPDYQVYIRLESKSAESVLAMPQISLEEYMKKALQNRADLKQARNRLSSMELSLKQAQLDRWPQLTAQANYNAQISDYLRERDAFKNYRSWNVLARVSFPIFDGGVSKNREEKINISLQQMKEDISDLERSIALEVQQAYLNLERAKKGLDVASEQVRNALESLNVTQERYATNLAIFLEVLSAQARYAQALNNQVRAFYDYKLAEKSLQKAIGMLSEK